jgi:CRP/FNR family cyclic AMP-dependent transcriptional regulator
VPATGEETIILLGRVPVFSSLDPEELSRVAEVAVPRSYAPGEVVFRERDQSNTCYVVRAGRARAVREHTDGRLITLAHFGPGDIFGELAMFDNERRSATVEALEPTEVTAILAGDMRRLMREHPDIAVKLLSALARRLRETNERLTRQSFQTVQSRVASVLAEMVRSETAERAEGGAARREEAGGAARAGVGAAREEDGGAARAGGVAARAGGVAREGSRGPEPAPGAGVLITATQAELAQLAGSSRESASRFLAVLERAGVITQGRGKLIVHDPEALGRYVY